MFYKKNYYSNISDYEIREYKNGYFIGLVGSHKAIRIFVAKSVIMQFWNNRILVQNRQNLLLHKFYLAQLHRNFLMLKYRFVRYIESIISLKSINMIWRYHNLLWFKGRSFRINKARCLFINNGRIRQPKFYIPFNIVFTLSRKRKFLRLRSSSHDFVQLYIRLLQNVYKPNPYTGKGIRIKKLLFKRLVGKRKIY